MSFPLWDFAGNLFINTLHSFELNYLKTLCPVVHFVKEKWTNCISGSDWMCNWREGVSLAKCHGNQPWEKRIHQGEHDHTCVCAMARFLTHRNSEIINIDC